MIVRPFTHLIILAVLLGSNLSTLNALPPRPKPAEGSYSTEQWQQGISLLYSLAAQQQDLAEILIIKDAPKDVHEVVSQISKLNQEMVKEIEKRFDGKNSVKHWKDGLPLPETEARGVVAARTARALLDHSGDAFKLQLLITQTSALPYTSALIEILHDVEQDAEWRSKWADWKKQVDALNVQVIDLL